MKKWIIWLLVAVVLIGPILSPVALAKQLSAPEMALSLSRTGLIKGTGNGYQLDSQLTRAEAATVLSRLAGVENAPAGEPIFDDVPVDHWAAGNIRMMYRMGVIKGYSETEFAPEKSVTALQFATMLMRLLNHDPNITTVDAPRLYAGLTRQSEEKAAELMAVEPFTRGHMVRFLYEASVSPYASYELNMHIPTVVWKGSECAVVVLENQPIGSHWSYELSEQGYLTPIDSRSEPLDPNDPTGPQLRRFTFRADCGGTKLTLTFKCKSAAGTLLETRSYIVELVEE